MCPNAIPIHSITKAALLSLAPLCHPPFGIRGKWCTTAVQVTQDVNPLTVMLSLPPNTPPHRLLQRVRRQGLYSGGSGESQILNITFTDYAQHATVNVQQ